MLRNGSQCWLAGQRHNCAGRGTELTEKGETYSSSKEEKIRSRSAQNPRSEGTVAGSTGDVADKGIEGLKDVWHARLTNVVVKAVVK